MEDTEAKEEGQVGPTLSATAPGERPKPLPACASCPKAMWYRTAQQLRAFCRELRHVTWQNGEREPILQCDGREAALILSDDRPTSFQNVPS